MMDLFKMGESRNQLPIFIAQVMQLVVEQALTFESQIVMICSVVITCLINLTLYPKNENQTLWISLLTGSLALLLPSPKIKSSTSDVSPIRAKTVDYAISQTDGADVVDQ